jgi:basic membrane protein A
VQQAVDAEIQPGNFIGDVGLADFHDLADRVPDDVKAEIEALTEQVLSGEVPTGYQP